MSKMKKENENISWSLLAKDVSGELSAQEHLQLQKELAENPDIEKQVKKLWGDAHYAQELRTIDTENAWFSVRNKMNQGGKYRKFKFIASIAALFIVILASALFINIYTNQGQTVISTSEAVEEVNLPDGSIAVLNYGSKLSFPKDFTGETRAVKLSGEAYFDVVKNDEQPFIIETELLNIRVLGTSFNVKAYKGSGNSEVVVSNGKVKVDAISINENVFLEAGEAASFSMESNTLKTHKVFTSNYKAWKTKEIEFNDTNLKDIVRIIEETYHIEIELDENIASEKQVLNATFSQHSLEHVLGSVCGTFNLYYSIDNNIYYIRAN